MTSEEAIDNKAPVADAVARERDSFETSVLRLMYEVEEEGDAEDFFIDEERHSDEGRERLTAEERIDTLCDAFGISPADWAKSFIAGWSKNYRHQHEVEARDARYARRSGVSIGKYLTRLAWWALPIEDDESGDCTVVLLLKTEDDQVLALTSEGSFETPFSDDDEEESPTTWRFQYKADVLPTESDFGVAREEVGD